ncbi:MAG: hypothetical protein Q8K75_05800 [Chlamydiales bacterium]|nr:hypothetical protein [Chlamydiales bacterium]
MFNLKFLNLLFLSILSTVILWSSTDAHAENSDILLTHYSDIAITTDLEPDDVLALYIIFQKANDIYEEKGGAYPIKFIIVGEGETARKKARMEYMLGKLIALPDGVEVRVIEGTPSNDNIFAYDGDEIGEEILGTTDLKDIFDSPELTLAKCDYYKETGPVRTLERFLKKSPAPLLIVLKPPTELLSIKPELLRNATVMMYGSFNFRKIVTDTKALASSAFDDVRHQGDTDKLQALLNFFALHFKKVGIVESYGMLGSQASVFRDHEWSHDILQHIENSNEPFFIMFRKLVNNWNRYLFEKQLPDVKTALLLLAEANQMPQIEVQTFVSQLDQLAQKWDEEQFDQLVKNIDAMIAKSQSEETTREKQLLSEKLHAEMHFAKLISPSSGLQFTLADVCVALALVGDQSPFPASPVELQVSDRGFLIPRHHPESSTFYYDRVDNYEFAQRLLELIM